MTAPLQLGFTDYEQTYAKKRTRRQRFLDEMETTVPWDAFLELISPVYHKPFTKGGCPPFPVEVMLQMLFALANLYIVHERDPCEA